MSWVGQSSQRGFRRKNFVTNPCYLEQNLAISFLQNESAEPRNHAKMLPDNRIS